MSETETGGKWTPGPWKYTASTPADGYEFFEIVQASRYVGTVNGPQNDEGTANARLIAASPAMAEALEKAIPVLLSAHENDASVVSWSALESARAALKLAKGE